MMGVAIMEIVKELIITRRDLSIRFDSSSKLYRISAHSNDDRKKALASLYSITPLLGTYRLVVIKLLYFLADVVDFFLPQLRINW